MVTKFDKLGIGEAMDDFNGNYKIKKLKDFHKTARERTFNVGIYSVQQGSNPEIRHFT